MNTKKANKQYKIIILPVLIIYILLVFLDILITYLTTPDLAMEASFISKTVRWKGIIILASSYILSSVFVYYKADKYIRKYFIHKNIKQTVSKIQSLSFYGLIILICAFYIHLLTSTFAVLNNTLSLIYVKKYSFLNEFATQYIFFYNRLGDIIIKEDYSYPIFFMAKNTLFWIIGIFIAVYKVRKLKKIQTMIREKMHVK